MSVLNYMITTFIAVLIGALLAVTIRPGYYARHGVELEGDAHESPTRYTVKVRI